MHCGIKKAREKVGIKDSEIVRPDEYNGCDFSSCSRPLSPLRQSTTAWWPVDYVHMIENRFGVDIFNLKGVNMTFNGK
ncbi:hypothetical protein CHS0354_029997, partial [Potamilus streckersoni]